MDYLDFIKVFNRLNHRMLPAKIQRCGTRDLIPERIYDFRLHMRLEVRVRMSIADQIYIEYGVPQCLVLGHRLFFVFINDLVNQITSNRLLYVGDMVWRVIRAREDRI